MLNSAVLDVVLGLAFTYLILALICTTVAEWVSGLLGTRGAMLKQGIAGLFGDQKLQNQRSFLDVFQVHPTVLSLQREPGKAPSYMSPDAFALTVIDMVTRPGSINFDDLENGIKDLPDGPVRSALLAAIQTSERDLPKAQQAIENWFNNAMDRVSGWYKRRQQAVTVTGAFIITVFANADSLAMANKLWANPTLRAEIVERAKANPDKLQKMISADYPDSNQPTNPSVNASGRAHTEQEILDEMNDFIGWRTEFVVEHRSDLLATIQDSPGHLAGWILTAIAVSLGAPFWFDTLKRLMNIRASGRNPNETVALKAGNE